METRTHAHRIVGALALALALAPAAARADTFTVAPGDAASLQSALTQAAAHANSSGPDVVSIPAGTYSGTFTYTGDAVDVEGAGAASTTVTSAAPGSDTFELDAADSTVSGLDIANTATTYGVALQLIKGGTVRDSEFSATGTNVVGLVSSAVGSVSRTRFVLGATDAGVRLYNGSALTMVDSTLEGVGGSARGLMADSPGASLNVARLRSTGVPTVLRALSGGTLKVSDSLIVLPKGTFATALEAGDSNNPSDSTSKLDADRVTIVGDPTANQSGAFVFANSAGDNFAVSIHDSVISGVARPLSCTATAGTGKTSADWSSLPAAGDVTSGAGCASTRTNAVAGASVFVDPAAGDYHQRYDSPLIDAGDPALLAPTEDLEGLARPVGRVDLGAYEYQRRAPVVSVDATPATAATGQVVTFAAAASDPDPGDSPLAYAWSFDDGTTATGQSATHAFVSAGAHTATVTVTDPSNLTASASTTVTVAAPGSGPVLDRTAPSVTLLVRGREALRNALRRGIRATIGCSEACSYRAALLLGAGARRRVVGRAAASLTAAGTRRLTIKLTPRGRAVLRRLGHARLRVQAIATDRAGNIGRARTHATTLVR